MQPGFILTLNFCKLIGFGLVCCKIIVTMIRKNLRLQQDIREVFRMNTMEGDYSISLKIAKDKLDHFHATIDGPCGTPYETGKFKMCIHIPDKYPEIPPLVKFRTKVWHPNVLASTGGICLNILADDWTPQLSLRTMLISIQALLSAPEADDPLDHAIGIQCKYNRDVFNLTAQVWTYIYAEGTEPVAECQEKIQHLVDMGVPRDCAVDIMSRSDWKLEDAIRTATHYIANREFDV